ncbi:Fic family protein [Serinicoccus sp. LYQ131]|uniref:Fic family protein n=1 Tax=Serinicoccus sp. LYQ131 TaxID=3378797 RepID=UPI0038519EE8
MAFAPDYGETLLSHEEAEALTSEARRVLGDPIRKADLYDLEQRIQVEVADEWWGSLLNFDVPMRDLLNDHFVRDLHRHLYAPIWEWGGRLRSRETNIGIAPEHVAVEMRNALDDLSSQWAHQTGVDARTLGIAAHAALVRIHPFVDGNGRVTRLLADLVYLAGQTGWKPIHAYDWEVDRSTYIRLLRDYDMTRNPSALAEFIPVISLEGVE